MSEVPLASPYSFLLESAVFRLFRRLFPAMMAALVLLAEAAAFFLESFASTFVGLPLDIFVLYYFPFYIHSL